MLHYARLYVIPYLWIAAGHQCLFEQQSHVSMQRTSSWLDQSSGIIPDILIVLVTSLVLQLLTFALITPDGLVGAKLVLQVAACPEC